MTNDTKYIHNAETDEITIVELTDAEQNQLNNDRIQIAAERQAQEASIKQKKIEVEEKLATLGLSIDDLKVLGLG